MVFANLNLTHSKAFCFLTVYMILLMPFLSQSSFIDNIFGNRQSREQLENLLQTYSTMQITTMAVQILPSGGQKTLATSSSSIILKKDFFDMFPKKTKQKISFKHTPETIKGLGDNSIFVRTIFSVEMNDQNYQVYEEQIRLTREFPVFPEQGAEIFLRANKSMNSNETQRRVLTRLEFYVLTNVKNYTLERNVQRTRFASRVEDHSGNKTYAFVHPFGNRINTLDPDNYVPFEDQISGDRYELEVNIKMSESELLPNLLQLVSFFKFDLMELDSFEGDDEQKAYKLLGVRLFKNVILEGSFLKLSLWIFQYVLTYCGRISLLIAGLVQLWLLKNAIKYRGISLSAVMITFWMSLFSVLSRDLDKSFEQLPFMLILLLVQWKFEKWLVNKIATIRLVFKYPILSIDGSEWYNIYKAKDISCAQNLIVSILLTTSAIILYPFICENYRDQLDSINPSVWRFCIKRFSLAMKEYMFVFYPLCQIMLNYKLKSGNGVSWRLSFFTMLAYGANNIKIILSPSIWVVLYCLKEEILLLVLIYQKLKYGNNLEHLPLPLLAQIPGNNDGNDGNLNIGNGGIRNQQVQGMGQERPLLMRDLRENHNNEARNRNVEVLQGGGNRQGINQQNDIRNANKMEGVKDTTLEGLKVSTRQRLRRLNEKEE